MKLKFLTFDLAWGRRCKNEYVAIEENWKGFTGKYCGSSIPPEFLSPSGSFKLTYSAYGRYKRRAFSLVISGEKKFYVIFVTSIMYTSNIHF